MTTSSHRAVTKARLICANWPALLLPVLAAALIAMYRYHDEAPWAGVGALAVLFTVAWPALAAKVAPFALLG